MEITRFIDIPYENLTLSEKIEFIEECIRYLHERLEEEELDPAMRAIGFIGTTGTVAAAWSMIALGMVSPIVAIPGAIVVGGSAIASAISLATDYIQAPEVTRLQKKLISILQSKEAEQWAKLWEEVGTDNFIKRLQYAATGSFGNKGQFLHMTGRHPFDVAVMFGGGVRKPSVGSQTRLTAIEAQVVEERSIGEAISSSPEQSEQPAQQKSDRAPTNNSTLPPFDRDRIINESKGLMIIGDMGAAKTCVAQHIANGFEGHGIIIFDPHGMTDWGNAYVITKMGAIYEQMRILLDLLENGDTTPLLIICDEWLEIRGDRRNKKGSEYAGLADDFIRLFSTKPRKFNKLAAFVLHSPNVEAAGVDSFLRENYLKIYLGRLAKKEFPSITDCAYPCVLEDEQQEHPTHGHHAEFKPKGKAPRNLEPLQSAPINIPLAYMKGSEVEVCDRGWADGQLRLEVENIRQRLELLLDSSALEPNPESNSSITQNPEPLNQASEPLNQPTDEGCTDLKDGSQFSSEDGSERFTPLNLTKEQVLALIENLNSELNQTQIIERLWQVKKGGSAAWKEAREQFKQLTGE